MEYVDVSGLKVGLKGIENQFFGIEERHKSMVAATILAGMLAERSQSPMSYAQMVSKAVALMLAVEREVRGE